MKYSYPRKKVLYCGSCGKELPSNRTKFCSQECSDRHFKGKSRCGCGGIILKRMGFCMECSKLENIEKRIDKLMADPWNIEHCLKKGYPVLGRPFYDPIDKIMKIS